ncbi:MAG: hypothetical protein FJ096_18185 [Deltaproteobacteria bacterium]|nr:hypothetical protein [Deltaproteobacteria bacterium]
MQLRATVLGVGLVVSLLACKKGEDVKQGGDKEVYAKILGIVKDPVAIMSAFLPYLDPKPLAGKFAPARRPDFDRSATFAANGIRHAANNARQKLQAESSSIAATLADPFVAVTRACADLPDLESAAKCTKAVQALDAALQDTGGKAASAGVPEAFPRIGEKAVNDLAKKEVAPLAQAMGGGKAELAFFATLEDAAASPQAVVDGCQGAEDEGTSNMRAVEKIDEEVRKVAAVHREMLKAVCARIGRADKARSELDACVKEKEKSKALPKERDDECRRVCTAGDAVIKEGIPAATYAKIPELYKTLCEKPDAATP